MAVGYPLPSPFFYGTDANGDPLAGGLLYVYASGTSTPIATYADQALTILNPHPIVLDASGLAEVYVPSGTVYLAILKNAAGQTQWSGDTTVPAIPVPAEVLGVPTGAILPYGGQTAPSGYLLCNDTPHSRITYAALFAVIGTSYGAGNNSTTFNVPDLRQRFPLGLAASGTGAVLGSTGGTIDHVHTGPSHTHTSPAHTHTMAHTHAIVIDGYGTVNNNPNTSGRLQTGSGTGLMAQATTEPASGGSSTANTGSTAATTDAGGTGNTGSANPAFCTVNFIIKT